MNDVGTRRVIVYHSGYGCGTGCCGHWVALLPEGAVPTGPGWLGVEDIEEEKFSFDHADDEDPRAFAERMIREQFGEEHVADLDWENSEIIND